MEGCRGVLPGDFIFVGLTPVVLRMVVRNGITNVGWNEVPPLHKVQCISFY